MATYGGYCGNGVQSCVQLFRIKLATSGSVACFTLWFTIWLWFLIAVSAKENNENRNIGILYIVYYILLL